MIKKYKYMAYCTYYTPVVKEINNGVDSYFTVNGASSKNRDEAIRLTKKHVSFKNKDTLIIRVDEKQVFENE